MSFYHDHLLPHLLDLACGTSPIARQRAKIVPLASGRVLEVGMGSGHNLSFYDPARVEFVWGLEPSHAMRARAESRLARSPVEVHWLDLPGERIPLADHSVDTIVLTYTLCTIPDIGAALAQMRRVLKPDGRLLFCEHGAAPDAAVRRWQDRVNRPWRCVFGGCNLNRDVPLLLTEGGFGITGIDTMYLPGTPRFAGFNCWGEARPAAD
ncbi:MAG: class I SAM-dependent methyltransferase [Gammaproteobacteria bacterium]|nr:class I SAM-dependent methyltransferase [Gammaproteobacteria bacterium]MBP6051023.1 class I SAM-dependent methyltransferase [Pseudomonadales bacterium]MBK6582530.1 class I SAM-dependent methyltransferase [Gammaproteobacteria bacterium]MBK7169675.1 class I SAM-dependent methyltransferase [Gammaproteobacteria bacterium]MBK7521203.1 class I SAM-dependent methyltransferase [Gammaproteobacteria bacterium]